MRLFDRIYAIVFMLLLIWYSLIFVNAGNLTVAGSVDLISLYTLLELFLLVSMVGIILNKRRLDFFTIIYLTLWGYLQWNAHWHFTFFKAPSEKVSSYYDFFGETLRLFPPSNTHTIPDLYHFIMGILILLCWVMAVIRVTGFIRKKAGKAN